jgi:hypothetical protein
MKDVLRANTQAGQTNNRKDGFTEVLRRKRHITVKATPTLKNATPLATSTMQREVAKRLQPKKCLLPSGTPN